MEYCDANQPIQKYRCSYKAFKWSKHSQKRKLFGLLTVQRQGNVLLSFLEAIFISSLHSERALHIKKKIKPIDECIRSSNLSDFMYAHIMKYCLIYFCVAFSRVLRIMTQNESCDVRQLYVVELAVGSEQKLYYFCYELSSRTSTGSKLS